MFNRPAPALAALLAASLTLPAAAEMNDEAGASPASTPAARIKDASQPGNAGNPESPGEPAPGTAGDPRDAGTSVTAGDARGQAMENDTFRDWDAVIASVRSERGNPSERFSAIEDADDVRVLRLSDIPQESAYDAEVLSEALATSEVTLARLREEVAGNAVISDVLAREGFRADQVLTANIDNVGVVTLVVRAEG